jgi:hypothetical protein
MRQAMWRRLKTAGGVRRRAHAPALIGLLLVLAAAPTANAALSVSRFSVTPSTTQAGGHPNLDVSIAFDPPTADVRDIALHLPPGLTASARAAPFCSRTNLVADLCPLETKVGSVGLVGEALGIEAEVRRNIYNVRPAGSERLRLGVPVFGSISRGGVALTLPVTARPADGGLDIAVAGPPREVAGYAVRLRELRFRLKGVVRRKIRGKVRRRFLLTNPLSCRPASTVLDVSAHEGPPPRISKVSTFTPKGCS